MEAATCSLIEARKEERKQDTKIRKNIPSSSQEMNRPETEKQRQTHGDDEEAEEEEKGKSPLFRPMKGSEEKERMAEKEERGRQERASPKREGGCLPRQLTVNKRIWRE